MMIIAVMIVLEKVCKKLHFELAGVSYHFSSLGGYRSLGVTHVVVHRQIETKMKRPVNKAHV